MCIENINKEKKMVAYHLKIDIELHLNESIRNNFVDFWSLGKVEYTSFKLMAAPSVKTESIGMQNLMFFFFFYTISFASEW